MSRLPGKSRYVAGFWLSGPSHVFCLSNENKCGHLASSWRPVANTPIYCIEPEVEDSMEQHPLGVYDISYQRIGFLPSSIGQVLHTQGQFHWSMERLPSSVEQMLDWIDPLKQSIVDILAYTCLPHEGQAIWVNVLRDGWKEVSYAPTYNDNEHQSIKPDGLCAEWQHLLPYILRILSV